MEGRSCKHSKKCETYAAGFCYDQSDSEDGDSQSGREERQCMEDGKIRQIGRTLAYIEDHLEEPLDLNRVSGQSGYSKYHLHRMFSRGNRIRYSCVYTAPEADTGGLAPCLWRTSR